MTGEGAASASASSAGASVRHLIPWAILPGSLRQACASSCVSVSAKQSATSGVSPARRADAASCRPEMAAIRTERGSGREFLGKGVGVPEIEIERLLGLDHLFEQAGLGLVFDVAD